MTALPVGAWSLPQATAWRRARDVTDTSEPDALLAAPTLATWLRASGRATSLHLAAAVGGDAPPAAWLGLSVRAESPRAALQALLVNTEDLGALLDTWGWFGDPSPDAPAPPTAGSSYLVDQNGDPDSLLHTNDNPMPPLVPRVLTALGSGPQRIQLQVSITPAVADTALILAAERTARRAVSSEVNAGQWEQSPLTDQALRIHGQVTACLLEVRLDGIPTQHRALRSWVARALSNDLHGDLCFSDVPGTLSLHGSRAESAIEVALIHTSRSDADAPLGDLPF